EDVIEAVQVLLPDRPRPAGELDPAPARDLTRPGVRRLSLVVIRRARGVDLEAMLEPVVPDQGSEDRLRHRRTTDVAQADEEDANGFCLHDRRLHTASIWSSTRPTLAPTPGVVKAAEREAVAPGDNGAHRHPGGAESPPPRDRVRAA